MFCFHDWSKWSKAYDARSGTRQSRVCKKCGKLSVRKVSSNEFAGDASINTGSADCVNGVFDEDTKFEE